MKKLLVFLLIVAALLVAGDFVAKNVGEAAAARQLKDRLQLEAEPDVSFGGFPFLLNVLRGTLPDVNVSAGELTRSGLTLIDVELTLNKLRFELQDAHQRRRGLCHGEERRWQCEHLRERDQRRPREGRRPLHRHARGRRCLCGAPRGRNGERLVGVAEGNLVLDPEGSVPAVTIPLPELFEEVEDVTATARLAEVRLDFRLGRLSFGELRSGDQ